MDPQIPTSLMNQRNVKPRLSDGREFKIDQICKLHMRYNESVLHYETRQDGRLSSSQWPTIGIPPCGTQLMH